MNNLKVLLLSFLFFNLSACGGGGGSEESGHEPESLTPMVLNQTYRVEQGQSVEKTSSAAQVEVEVDLVSGETTVTLINGTANLITPN